MIDAEQLPHALKALQRLIIHAKSLTYDAENSSVAELLNDVELLPEFLADENDRTEELVEMLESIAQVHPSCRYIVDEFERSATPAV